MILPDLGGREVRGSKRSQGKDFTPERLSAYAHVVGFRPPPVTSRVVQRTACRGDAPDHGPTKGGGE